MGALQDQMGIVLASVVLAWAEGTGAVPERSGGRCGLQTMYGGGGQADVTITECL